MIPKISIRLTLLIVVCYLTRLLDMKYLDSATSGHPKQHFKLETIESSFKTHFEEKA